MKSKRLSGLSVRELVHEFEKAAEQQAFELDANNIKTVNLLFWRLRGIEDELKARDGDQRRALLHLYDHPSMQVRLKAAKATLAVEPGLARHKLQEIADSKYFPQAGEAGMSLWNLDRGVYKPM